MNRIYQHFLKRYDMDKVPACIFLGLFILLFLGGVSNLFILYQGFNWINLGVGIVSFILAFVIWEGVDFTRLRMDQFVKWRNKYIWPFNAIQAWHDLWLAESIWAAKLLKDKMNLHADISNMGKFLGQYGLDIRQLPSTNGSKPIKIVYALHDVSSSFVARGDGHTGLLDVQYLYAVPQVYKWRESVDKMNLQPQSADALFASAIEDAVTRFRDNLVEELKDKFIA